jgi:hypothetical protein
MSEEDDAYESDDDVEMESDESYVAVAASDDSAPAEDAGVGAMRESLRKQLQADVEAFLAAGGRINQIPANVISDPPKKPESNYGGQPI